MWTIALPLAVMLPRKKKPPRRYALNLNVYRNTHKFILNQAKILFTELALPLVAAARIPKLERCTLEYVLYPGSARECDVNNVCTVVDKFFSDTLVEAGVLEDDNYKFLADIRSRFGAIDRANPRVEVVVRSPDHIPLVHPEPVQGSHETMKITTTHTIKLVEKDIENAITEYVQKYTPGVTLDSDSAKFKPSLPTSLEITLESEEGEDPKTHKTGKKATSKPEKQEPAAAMAALNAQAAPTMLPNFSRVTPVPAEAHLAPASELPLVGEEKGHADALVSASATQEAAAPSQEAKTPEAPPPPKAPSLFASFKRPSNP